MRVFGLELVILTERAESLVIARRTTWSPRIEQALAPKAKGPSKIKNSLDQLIAPSMDIEMRGFLSILFASCRLGLAPLDLRIWNGWDAFFLSIFSRWLLSCFSEFYWFSDMIF